MFLIPIGTTQKFRKIPVITIILISSMVLIFMSTHGARKAAEKELYRIQEEVRIIVLNELKYDHDYAKLPWNEQKAIYNQKMNEAFGGTLKLQSDHAQITFDELHKELEAIRSSLAIIKFRFDPKKPSVFTAVTSAFIHGGFMHLISNMWFLFLFGALVEDFLGKVNYIIFFIAGAIGSAYIHGAMSEIPVIGASGVISGLMAAFLVFFFNREIKYFLIMLLIYRVYTKTFLLKAYLALPIWFAVEIVNHMLDQADNIAHSGHIGGFLTGAVITSIIRFTPLYPYLKEKYFVSSSLENPQSYIDDIVDQMALGKHRKALDIAQKALEVMPDFLPLHEKKLEIYRAIKDRASLRTVYKKIFPILVRNDVSLSNTFLAAYSDFGDEILSNDIMPAILFDMNTDHMYESTCSFGELFLKRATRQNRVLYSTILSSVAVALMASKNYDEALIKAYEGILLNKKHPKQLTKFREQRKEIFARKFRPQPHQTIMLLIELDELRLNKNPEEFISSIEKLADLKEISFSFEQLLYYSEILHPKEDFKKVGNIFKIIVSSYKDHPLLHIVYFRMGKLLMKVKEDKQAAMRYYEQAFHLCQIPAHTKMLENEINKLREGLE